MRQGPMETMMHEITEVHPMNIRFDTRRDISREISQLPRKCRFSVLYIIKFGNDIYKFGRTSSLHQRMNVYINDIKNGKAWHGSTGFNLLYIIKYKNELAAERALGTCCKRNKIKGEWFRVLEKELCDMLETKISKPIGQDPIISCETDVENNQPENMENDIIITPKVDSIGRVMIPKHVREAIGIEPGDLAEIAVRRKQHKKEDATSDPVA